MSTNGENVLTSNGGWRTIEDEEGGDQVKTIGERIKQYRYDNILSQMQFAKMCHLSKQTVNSLEQGTQDASMLTMAKIEKVIGKEEQ